MLEGHFQLASGRHSDRYLEKFNLLQWPQHTEAVCRKLAEGARELDVQTVAGIGGKSEAGFVVLKSAEAEV